MLFYYNGGKVFVKSFMYMCEIRNCYWEGRWFIRGGGGGEGYMVNFVICILLVVLNKFEFL